MDPKEIKDKLSPLSKVEMSDELQKTIIDSIERTAYQTTFRQKGASLRKRSWIVSGIGLSTASVALVIVGLFLAPTKPTSRLNPTSTITNAIQIPGQGQAGINMPARITWDNQTYAVTSEKVQKPGKHIGKYLHFDLYAIPGVETKTEIAICARNNVYVKATRVH